MRRVARRAERAKDEGNCYAEFANAGRCNVEAKLKNAQ